MWLKQIFCSHKYKLVNSFVTQSEFEQVKRVGNSPNTWHSLKKYYVNDYCCESCGKLKRFKINNT